MTSDSTGPLGASNEAAERGLKLWEKWTNANGGILGHKVRVEVRDTKSDVTTLVTGTKELLTMKDMVAFVPGSSMGDPIAKLVTAAKIPFVGGLMDDTLWFTNANVFPVGTTPDNLNAALVIAGNRKLGKPGKFADFYCAEVPVCKTTLEFFKTSIKKHGGELSYQASISGSAPDYTAQCVAAKQKGADTLWIAAVASTIQRVAADCKKNNYTPLMVQPQYANSELKDANLEGMLVVSPVANPSADAAKTFRDAVAKFDPKLLDGLASPTFSVQMWTSGEVIRKAIETANPAGDVTAQDIYDGLYALKDEELGGLTPPLNFVKGKPTSIACFFDGELTGGAIVQESVEATCPSS